MGSLKSEVETRNSEVRSAKSELRSRKSEVRTQKLVVETADFDKTVCYQMRLFSETYCVHRKIKKAIIC